MQINIKYYKSPVGGMILGSMDNKLCLADWKNRTQRRTIDHRLQHTLNAEYTYGTTKVIAETIEELEEYFAGKRSSFEIPLLFTGTAFQKSVWSALQKIPYGSVLSYKELATNIGNEKAFRAVALANSANAISILVPCHRVIGNDGSIKGYAGGIEANKKLLTMEQKFTY